MIPLTADETFAANRAVGEVRFDVHGRGGVTRKGALHEAGSLRVRFPSAEGEGLSAVFVNTAGGIAGGDRFSIAIDAVDGAHLAVTTAAAEKIYRARDAAADIRVALRAANGAGLVWLPQETILFDRARVERRFDIAVESGASLVLGEIVAFGRLAMGERMNQGAFTDRWRLRLDGRLAFAETIRLGDEFGERLSRRAIANGGCAIGTLLFAPGDEALATRIRDARYAGEVGVSSWNGFAMMRLCAQDGATARKDMMTALRAGGAATPRLWLN